MREDSDRPDPSDWWGANAPPPPPPVTTGPIPTNPDGSQVGSGTPWAPGASAPTGAPPGYHWDPNYAMFVKDAAPPAPVPPPNPNPDPTNTGGDNRSNGGIGVPTSGFGAAPPRYASDPNAPQYQSMPTYTPPTWTGGDYVNPTVDELYASPGYQARLDSRLQGDARHYAAQGTILNGGTVKALDRSAQDYATGEYQTLRNNTYDAYVQKYKQFTDAAGLDLQARTQNANENQNTFQNNTQTYLNGNTRTLSDYITNLNAQRNSELDYWSRLKDVSGTGADLAGGSR